MLVIPGHQNIENIFPCYMYVQTLIERISKNKKFRKLKPFEGHFGAVACYLSIFYVGPVIVYGIR